MNHTGTAVLLSAALGFLLFAHPAEGTQSSLLAPRLKGVVISHSERVLVIDQVLRAAAEQPRTARIVLSARTRIAGRRTTAAAIRVNDLVRADGILAPDGSLEALHLEVVLTADEISVAHSAPAGLSGRFWQWILNGSLTIPLP